MPRTLPPAPFLPLLSRPLLGSLALALRLKAINFAGLLLPWHIFACLSFKTIFIIVAAASERGLGAWVRGKAWQGVLQGLGLGLICILSKTSRKLKLKTKPKLRRAEESSRRGVRRGEQRETGSVIWPITFTASLLQSVFSISLTTHAPFPFPGCVFCFFFLYFFFFAFVFAVRKSGSFFTSSINQRQQKCVFRL